MHKKLMIILPLLLILIIASSAVIVYAEDSDLYKNLDETAQESGDDYFVNYRDNYELDTQEISFFKDAKIVMPDMFSNLIFFFQKGLATLTISIFSFAFSTNIVEVLGGFIEPFILAMKASLWDELSTYAIAFAAFVMLLKMAQNRTSQALSSLIGVVLIIAMAFMFYAYPIQMLRGIDNVTNCISDAVMEGPYKASVGGNATDAKGKASALCWNLLVHKPWQVLEFGSVKTAQKYEADILKLDPSSEERKELIEKLAESEGLFSKSSGFQYTRLTTAMVVFLFNILLMIVLIAFSALIIGYRLLMLIYLALGIFVFLIALLPYYGIFTIRKWGMRVISISFTRVMIVFFLSITLVFMDVVYKFIDEYGLFMVLFIIIVLVTSIWFERYRLLDLLSAYRTTENQLQQNMNNSLETDYNSIENMRNLRRKALKVMENINKDGLKSKSESNEKSSQTENKSNDSKVMRVKGSDTKASAKDNTKGEQTSEKLQKSAENMKTASQDMSMYFKSAEALLQKQYEYSKTKAEEGADKKESVEYDDFVKRTDQVRSKGLGNFDNRDISNVANIMRKTVDRGGKVSDVVSDGKSIYREKQKNVNRPQSLNEVRNNFDSPEASNKNKSQAKKLKGIEYFKSNFGDEQGEEIYENLVEKYGKNKIKNYRPFYNNNGKQSFAQVVKQLNENIDTTKLTKESKKPKKTIKLRSGGGK